jgi:hypothetical protein
VVNPIQFIFGYLNDMMPELGLKLLFLGAILDSYTGLLTGIGGFVNGVIGFVLGFIPGF